MSEPRAKRTKRASSTQQPASTEGLSRYDVGALLGQGAFASVRRAKDRVTGEEVAVKEIFRERTGTAAAAQEVAEALLLLEVLFLDLAILLRVLLVVQEQQVI